MSGKLAIQWGLEPVYYEAEINYSGNSIISIGARREDGFKTRISAQIACEKLLVDWVTTQYKDVGM